MRIDKLVLENFRCFEKFELELHPQCTVLIGNNGAGKTAILDASRIAIGQWIRGFDYVLPTEIPLISVADVRYFRAERSALPTLVKSEYSRVRASGNDIYQGTSAHWELTRQHEPEGWSIDFSGLEKLVAKARADLQAVDSPATLPVLASFHAGRRWSNASQPQEEMVTSRLAAYQRYSDAEANRQRVEAWIAWQERARIQQIAEVLNWDGDPRTDVSTPHLDAVTKAVRDCIPNCRRFFYSIRDEELRLELDEGEPQPVPSLSGGYRNMIAMAADIAWRTVQLNPHLGEEAPKKTPGIVLVDEIDLHLHARWQRTVLERLIEVFPRLQFIVSTHSPQVVASAKPEWMRVLDADSSEAGRTGPVHGRDTNSILRDIMGVPPRPQWMEDKLDRLARLIEDGELDAAKTLLDEVREDLGANDSTVVGLEWELSLASPEG